MSPVWNVNLNGEDYVLKSEADNRLLKTLVKFYQVDPVCTAIFVNEELDTSGALLKRVRRAASAGHEHPKPK